MLIRIPGATKTSKNEALARCIEFAACHTGADEWKVAEIISYFLEQLADETTKGRSVTIPGFGGFFPTPDKKYRKPGDVLKCRIKFHPCEGYAHQVRHGAPPQEENLKRWNKYQEHHARGDGSPGVNKRVFIAQARFREAISAQIGHAHRP